MSLILEALRKSEAERRRGRAPDLHAELPPTRARNRRMPPPWLWIAATVALLLVAMLLWIRGRDAPGSVARSEPMANTVQEARAPADEGEPATALPPPYPRVDRIAAPPAEPAPTPASAASPAPRTEEQSEDGAVANTAPAREPSATPTPSAPAVTATEAPSSPANAPAPTSTPTPTPTRGAIARLSELPPGERKQLPAMKLSMHLWNESPAQRFVIIDGQRYVEGDRIGSAVIDAIDSDGVILDLNGRAVRVPIR
jgi:general secretion pathway protein B